jgi:hypothetical protein
LAFTAVPVGDPVEAVKAIANLIKKSGVAEFGYELCLYIFCSSMPNP